MLIGHKGRQILREWFSPFNAGAPESYNLLCGGKIRSHRLRKVDRDKLTANWGHRDFMRHGRSLAVGDRGLAATSHPLATQAAIDILKAGGNAVDAAIAAIALQGVVDPHMTGIGGDCFALYAPAGGTPIAIDGSGRAPAAANLGWFLECGMTSIADDSVHAVTVPGAVSAWCRLNADHGQLPLDTVLAPAIRVAEEGFVVTPRVGLDWTRYGDRVARHGQGIAAYLPGGLAPGIGARLDHPALARTLQRIAASGAEAFYRGDVADDIIRAQRSCRGLMTLDDLAEFEAQYRVPIGAEYRDHRILECPPAGQGVAALLILRTERRRCIDLPGGPSSKLRRPSENSVRLTFGFGDVPPLLQS